MKSSASVFDLVPLWIQEQTQSSVLERFLNIHQKTNSVIFYEDKWTLRAIIIEEELNKFNIAAQTALSFQSDLK